MLIKTCFKSSQNFEKNEIMICGIYCFMWNKIAKLMSSDGVPLNKHKRNMLGSCWIAASHKLFYQNCNDVQSGDAGTWWCFTVIGYPDTLTRKDRTSDTDYVFTVISMPHSHLSIKEIREIREISTCATNNGPVTICLWVIITDWLKSRRYVYNNNKYNHTIDQ